MCVFTCDNSKCFAKDNKLSFFEILIRITFSDQNTYCWLSNQQHTSFKFTNALKRFQIWNTFYWNSTRTNSQFQQLSVCIFASLSIRTFAPPSVGLSRFYWRICIWAGIVTSFCLTWFFVCHDCFSAFTLAIYSSKTDKMLYYTYNRFNTHK